MSPTTENKWRRSIRPRIRRCSATKPWLQAALVPSPAKARPRVQHAEDGRRGRRGRRRDRGRALLVDASDAGAALPDRQRDARRRDAHRHGERHGQSDDDRAGRHVRFRRAAGSALRLQHAGEGGPAVREDRPAPLSNRCRSGKRRARHRARATREGQSRACVREGDLRPRRRSAETPHRVAGDGRYREQRARPGGCAGRARRKHDCAARSRR